MSTTPKPEFLIKDCRLCGEQFEAKGEFLKRKKCPKCLIPSRRETQAAIRERYAALTVKTCSRCGETGAAENFGKFGMVCKPCGAERARLRRANQTPESRQLENKRRSDRMKQKRAKNPEYYRDLDNKANARRSKEEKARRGDKARKYAKERRKTDTNTRLRHASKARIIAALKDQGTRKVLRTSKLLGCTIPHLRAYLESLFQDGMTWENRGQFGWHVDHIKPCKDFDLSKEEEQRKCFHYTNLRPLWWRDNLARNRKYGND